MIDHVTIRVSNLEKSKLFTPLRWKWSFGEDGAFAAFDIGKGCLFEIAQYEGDGLITSSHIAFRVESKDKVQAFYNSGIDAGAKDNGKPGPDQPGVSVPIHKFPSV